MKRDLTGPGNVVCGEMWHCLRRLVGWNTPVSQKNCSQAVQEEAEPADGRTLGMTLCLKRVAVVYVAPHHETKHQMLQFIIWRVQWHIEAYEAGYV